MAGSSRMGQAWINQSSAREVDSQSDSNGVETMAGDWIKMRTDLYRDPKVCIMAEALDDESGALADYVSQNCQRTMTVTRNVMRNAVVGSLVTVWGTIRHTGKRIGNDLLIKNATTFVIDDIADLPGLGKAMESIGWVRKDENGLVFPGFFDEHNVEPSSSSKTNAERQRAWRERQKMGSQLPVTKSNDRNGRGEERREEKEVGGRRTDRPTVSASPSLTDQPVAEVAEKAATAYQERRYKTPNPRAAYLPVLLQEAADVFDSATDKAAALQLFLNTCRDSPLPKEASFSDLAKSCGLKKQKAKGTDRPSQQFKDFTAERLAKQMTVS